MHTTKSSFSMYQSVHKWETEQQMSYLEKQEYEREMIEYLKSDSLSFADKLKCFLQYSNNNINKFFTVKGLLEGVNPKMLSAVSLLHIAASLGNCSIVKLLLDNNANIDIQLADGSTPLHIASTIDMLPPLTASGIVGGFLIEQVLPVLAF